MEGLGTRLATEAMATCIVALISVFTVLLSIYMSDQHCGQDHHHDASHNHSALVSRVGPGMSPPPPPPPPSQGRGGGGGGGGGIPAHRWIPACLQVVKILPTPSLVPTPSPPRWVCANDLPFCAAKDLCKLLDAVSR